MSRNRILRLTRESSWRAWTATSARGGVPMTCQQYQSGEQPIVRALEDVAKFLYGQTIFDADDLPYPLHLVVMAALFVILGEGIRVRRFEGNLREKAKSSTEFPVIKGYRWQSF